MAVILSDLTETLTDRELEILFYVAEGYRDRQICERLHLSRQYVQYVVAIILAKMHVRTRSHAVAVAVRKGII